VTRASGRFPDLVRTLGAVVFLEYQVNYVFFAWPQNGCGPAAA
jgi:hypothetical protein